MTLQFTFINNTKLNGSSTYLFWLYLLVKTGNIAVDSEVENRIEFNCSRLIQTHMLGKWQ